VPKEKSSKKINLVLILRSVDEVIPHAERAEVEVDSYLQQLYEENPDALACVGADGLPIYVSAIAGIARRCGDSSLLVYAVEKIIDCLVSKDGMSRSDAEEFCSFNIEGSSVGDGTPLFLQTAPPLI
jgi:hypothetical protein